MNNTLFTIITTLIGMFVTFIVAFYFYKKTFKFKLTPFLLFYSSPLDDIDKEVLKDLEIKYKTTKINNLLEIQFLIANTGDKAIKNIIEQLTLEIPNNCFLLDSVITHISPEGRKVILIIDENKKKIKFEFQLLNSRDFFIIKLLIDGKTSPSNFKFTIVSEELPPILKYEYLPSESLQDEKKKYFKLPALITTLIFLIFCLSLDLLIINNWKYLPSITQLGFYNFIIILGLHGWAIIFSIIPAFLFSIIGILAVGASFTGGTFPPPQKRFILPKKHIELLKGKVNYFRRH